KICRKPISAASSLRSSKNARLLRGRNPVGDLVIDPKSDQADYDTLKVVITEACSPDVWKKAGGPGQITALPVNQSLIIKATAEVHEQVAELLTKLRKDKFGPDYQFTPGVADQAAD